MTRQNSGRRLLAAAVAMTAMLIAGACAPPPTVSSSTQFVNPCTTQSGISCDFVFQHAVTVPGGSTTRHQLVVMLNGTGANPETHFKLNSVLAAKGFHVINLRYDSAIGTSSACPNEVAIADPECFRKFRAEIVVGENVPDPFGLVEDSPALTVTAPNSVTNRLLQLVRYLAVNSPSAGWNDYLQHAGGACDSPSQNTDPCDIDWSKVIVMGHSLGAGVALYLAKLHHVARVAMLSGPVDSYVQDGATVTAPWISDGQFATPATSMFALEHTGDYALAAETTALDALGLDPTPVSVDSNVGPYANAQRLTTSITPACITDLYGPHNSTAQDACTPGTPPELSPAWTYLAGA